MDKYWLAYNVVGRRRLELSFDNVYNTIKNACSPFPYSYTVHPSAMHSSPISLSQKLLVHTLPHHNAPTIIKKFPGCSLRPSLIPSLIMCDFSPTYLVNLYKIQNKQHPTIVCHRALCYQLP